MTDQQKKDKLKTKIEKEISAINDEIWEAESATKILCSRREKLRDAMKLCNEIEEKQGLQNILNDILEELDLKP